MKIETPSYRGHRFPPEIISHAVWLYYRFCLSLRDVEDLLAERGVTVSYETIRQWCRKFGIEYARKLKRRDGRLGDTWYLDEVFVKIQGQRQYLWRAVDQDGDVIDILVQPRRNRRAAERFFRKLLKGQEWNPTGLLRTNCAAMAPLIEPPCPPLSTIRGSTPTTERRSRISRRDSESDRCAGSSRQAKPSASSPFTESSRTSSGLGGTSSALATTVRCEIIPSASGDR